MRFSSSPNRPEAWKEMKLADVCKTFTSGGTPSRKKLEYFENGTIPWVRTKELNDGVITEVEEFITPEALKNSSAKLLPKNTVLLAMYGATVGKLGVLGFESSCNQACAAMVPKDGVVDYRYLYYLLLNHRELIISQATGGAQQNLSGELIKGFTFDFPTYKEQQAISEVLWKIDEKIAANNSLSKTFEDIAQTIFKSWFIDFDPVKAKMAGEKPAGMDAATAALFPDSMEESELGLIPKGWLVGSLGDIADLQGGYAFKSSSWMENGVPVIKIGSVKPGFVDLTQVSYVDVSTAEAIPDVYRIPAGSLVVGLTGYVGQVGLVRTHDPVPLVNQRVAKFKLNSGEWKIPYIYCFTRGEKFKGIVEELATGTAQQNVSNSQILSIPMVIPSQDIREMFDNSLKTFFHQIINLADENESLKFIRDALLPRLISGELQIPDEMLAS